MAPNNSEDSCQLRAKHKVATPVNWQQGDAALIEVRRVVEKNTTTVLRQKA